MPSSKSRQGKRRHRFLKKWIHNENLIFGQFLLSFLTKGRSFVIPRWDPDARACASMPNKACCIICCVSTGCDEIEILSYVIVYSAGGRRTQDCFVSTGQRGVLSDHLPECIRVLDISVSALKVTCKAG